MENIIVSLYFITKLSYFLILSLYYKAILANIRLRSYVIIILILCYKNFLANIRLRSISHKRLSGYVEHLPQLSRKTQAHVVHSLPISAIFCKNKIGDGWLADGEDPKKLTETLTNIVTIVNGCCNKSWCLCQSGKWKCNL